MRLQPVQIEFINRENFLRYGETLEVQRAEPGRAQRGEDEYRTLSRTPSSGWRLALHCVRTRWTSSLYTYDSRRALIPQRGALLLCIAPPDRRDEVHIFMLDTPVAVNAGIPHCLLALSAEGWVHVTENFETAREQLPLRKTLVPAGLWD